MKLGGAAPHEIHTQTLSQLVVELEDGPQVAEDLSNSRNDDGHQHQPVTANDPSLFKSNTADQVVGCLAKTIGRAYMSATDATAIRKDMSVLGSSGRTALPIALNASSLVGQQGLEEVQIVAAVDTTKITSNVAGPASKMNKKNKAVDCHQHA